MANKSFAVGAEPISWERVGTFLQNVGESYLDYIEAQEARKSQLEILQAQLELERVKAARVEAEEGIDIGKYLPWIAIGLAGYFMLKKK